MTARPSAEMLTSGIHGLDRRWAVNDGRNTTMTTSIAIIILVVLDIYILHEINILEENLRFVIKARQATQDELMKHIMEVHHDK